MVLAFAVLHGGAWGLRGPFMQAIRADYFGRSAIGMILGLSLMIIVVGQVGGPMIAGILADLDRQLPHRLHHPPRCSPASARSSSSWRASRSARCAVSSALARRALRGRIGEVAQLAYGARFVFGEGRSD